MSLTYSSKVTSSLQNLKIEFRLSGTLLNRKLVYPDWIFGDYSVIRLFGEYYIFHVFINVILYVNLLS